MGCYCYELSLGAREAADRLGYRYFFSPQICPWEKATPSCAFFYSGTRHTDRHRFFVLFLYSQRFITKINLWPSVFIKLLLRSKKQRVAIFSGRLKKRRLRLLSRLYKKLQIFSKTALRSYKITDMLPDTS